MIWASGSVLGAQAIMAVYGILTARLLGPDGKGIVTAVFTWSQLLAWGSVAGLSTAIGVGVAGADAGKPTDDTVRKALANAVLVTVGLTVAGQQLASLLVDQFGLLRLPRRPLTRARLAGVALLLAGVAVIQLT